MTKTAKTPLIKSKKSRHDLSKDWLDNCALEGIFPTSETLKELNTFDGSSMTTAEYRAHLINTYSQKNERE